MHPSRDTASSRGGDSSHTPEPACPRDSEPCPGDWLERGGLGVRFRDVRVEDSSRVLLDVPSLLVDGARTAVVGPNGSGKSTLLRLVNALTRPDSGRVELLHGDAVVDVSRSPESARQLVGFVFSDPLAQLLLPTPLEDVQLSLRALPQRDRRSAALGWLDALGVAHLADHSVYELSSGERQRVALASVLAAQPQLLILDEPTTLLDRLGVRRLESLLESLEIPIILATHDLDVASRYPRCLAMESGRVVDDGPGDAVVAAYAARVDALASPGAPFGGPTP